jgi:hypothetical protein
LTSESIASLSSTERSGDTCPNCGAPLAGDQRYCLECGERGAPRSSVLLGGSPQQAQTPASASGPGAMPPDAASGGSAPAPPSGAPRSSAATVIAGVGVLLLAMGVGVLIGRAGAGTKSTAAAPQVITVGTAPAAGSGAGSGEAAAFTDDWPAATSGYTVQLQTLPQAGTQVSAVEAAKSAATAKGAADVGALKSDDFGLPAGNYVIYSGVYHKKPEAEKALAGLKKHFAGATVIKVSGAAGAAGATSPKRGGAGATAPGASGSKGKPAPPKVLEDEHKTKGKSFEEKSKNLPNEVET